MEHESQSAPIVRLAVKGWSEFQHYKHRKPPWIRLYRKDGNNIEVDVIPAMRNSVPVTVSGSDVYAGKVYDDDAESE